MNAPINNPFALCLRHPFSNSWRARLFFVFFLQKKKKKPVEGEKAGGEP